MGVRDFLAHGAGVSAQTHLYTSFDSTAVSVSYDGKALPESNNSILQTTF